MFLRKSNWFERLIEKFNKNFYLAYLLFRSAIAQPLACRPAQRMSAVRAQPLVLIGPSLFQRHGTALLLSAMMTRSTHIFLELNFSASLARCFSLG